MRRPGRQVHPLAAGRWHDVRRVTHQRHPPPMHGLHHPGPHLHDGPIEQRPPSERPRRQRQPTAQLPPDTLLGPVLHALALRHLQVQARHLRRPQHLPREPVAVLSVDGVRRERRSPRQDAEEPHAVPDVVLGEGVGRQGGAHGTVLAGCLHHHLGAHRRAVRAPHHRQPPLGVQVDDRAAQQYRSARRLVSVQQVGHHLLLRVDEARGVAAEVCVVQPHELAVTAELARGVRQALGAQPLRAPETVQELHGAAFQETGAGPGHQLVAIELVDHHAGDAPLVQQRRQGQAGGPGADDSHLGFDGPHHSAPSFVLAKERGAAAAVCTLGQASAPDGTRHESTPVSPADRGRAVRRRRQHAHRARGRCCRAAAPAVALEATRPTGP